MGDLQSGVAHFVVRGEKGSQVVVKVKASKEVEESSTQKTQ